ncbi:MAG: hypothetical protein OEW00_00660 [candidate division Zixibacteria bacterium]|nr:hypothetical protein [candidate division Zixibacteria bacterium]
MKAIRCATIIVCLMSAEAAAFDYQTGRGVGLGGGILLSKSSASALVTLPSGGIDSGEIKVEMGLGRKFEMKELDQAFVAAAYRYRDVVVALGVAQFGHRDFYAERTAKLNVAYSIRRIWVGASVSGIMVDISQGYGQLRAAALGLGLAARTKRVVGAIVGDNLNSPALYSGGLPLKPRYSGFLEYAGSGSFLTVGRATFEAEQKPQFALGQFLQISKKAALFWGFATAPTLYGGGLEVNHKRAVISYAGQFHPVLGFTHQISLSYAFGGPATKQEEVF